MKYLLLVFTSLIVLASCTKTPSTTTGRADILQSKKWKIGSGTVEYKVPYDSISLSIQDSLMFGITRLFYYNNRRHSDTFVNIFRTLDSCRWDDYFAFNINNTGYNYLGAKQCSVADPDSIAFTWYLSNNDNNITFVNANNAFANNSIDAMITDFSSSSFTIKFSTVYNYIDSPYKINAAPIFHDTTWTPDTIIYKITYNSF